MATEVKYKFPKALGACADKLFELRNKRLAEQKKVDEIAAEETALKNHIIENLPKSEASGVAGKLAERNGRPTETPYCWVINPLGDNGA